MNYESKTLKISELFLDESNPRFPEVKSQREAIAAMLEEQGNKIAVLAEDIYANGLNASSRLIVFRENSRFTAGDGNRRLTALKVLETPSLADSHPRIMKRIQQTLTKKGEVLTEAECVVVKNRGQARRWIENNHDGEQDGRGPVQWNSAQKDRFRGKASIGLEALDRLQSKNLISDADRARINKSTLDRLLTYKNIKDVLKISRNGDGFTFGDMAKLKDAVLGLRDQKVDKVYTAEKAKAYLVDIMRTKDPENTEEGESGAPTRGSGRSRRIRNGRPLPFGGKLVLNTGSVNNLYRDIETLYFYYNNNRKSFTESFVVIFRMSLRILAETAGKELTKDLKDYLLDGFDSAKKGLDQNTKTTLSAQGIKKDSIVQLFQTGGHDYHNSKNEEQALALSIVLGRMLEESHGKINGQ